MAKKGYVGLRIDEGRKFALEALAKKHGLSLSELLLKGGTLYSQIPPAFIDEVQRMSDEMELPVSTLIVHNFQRWVASVLAYKKTFGKLPPGWKRAFQWDSATGKLIKGDNLSKILLHEYTELYQKLADNLIDSHEQNKPLEMSREQAAEFFAQL